MKQENTGRTSSEGKTALNQIFCDVVEEIQRTFKHAELFGQAVEPAQVPDYSDYVSPREEIFLSQILNKATAQSYSSKEEFLRDFDQIVANATAYNSAGKGQYGYEPVIRWSKELLATCKDVLDRKLEACSKVNNGAPKLSCRLHLIY